MVVRTLINDQIEKCLCAQQMVNQPRRTLPSELQRRLAASSSHPLPSSASLPRRVLAVAGADFKQGWDGLPGAATLSSKGPQALHERVGVWWAQVRDGLRIRMIGFHLWGVGRLLFFKAARDLSGQGWYLRSRLTSLFLSSALLLRRVGNSYDRGTDAKDPPGGHHGL